jgi:hypothetical protein
MKTYFGVVVSILRGASDVAALVDAAESGVDVPIPAPGAVAVAVGPYHDGASGGGTMETERPAGVKELIKGEGMPA